MYHDNLFHTTEFLPLKNRLLNVGHETGDLTNVYLTIKNLIEVITEESFLMSGAGEVFV